MGEAAKPLIFKGFQMFPNRLYCRFAWQAWHFVIVSRVWESVERRFVWQTQHFGDLHRHFAWQSQHFRRVVLRVLCESHCQGCVKCGDSVQIGWQMWNVVTCDDTPHSTLYTPHSVLYTPHSTLYTLHSTLHALDFTLHTLHSTLHTFHSKHHTLQLHTPHSTLYTPHSTPYTLHSTLYTLHSTLYTLHSSVYTSHSPPNTLRFTLHTLHSTLYTLHILHSPLNTLLSSHPTLCTPPSSTFHSLQCTGTVAGEQCTRLFKLLHRSFLRDCIRFHGASCFFNWPLVCVLRPVLDNPWQTMINPCLMYIPS